MNHFPPASALFHDEKSAYFADSYNTQIQYQGQSALEIFFVIARTTPTWVNSLMALRNRIAKALGLKHLGHFGDIDPQRPWHSYQPGERVGIFTLLQNETHEVILEDNDKHLRVRVSFLVEPQGQQAVVYASTIVDVHNRLGKAYMAVVGPIHQQIVPRSLRALQQTLAKNDSDSSCA